MILALPLFLTGLVSVLFAITLFASWSFWVLASLLLLATYLLNLPYSTASGRAFLAGLACGLELWGNAHPGLSLVLAAACLACTELLARYHTMVEPLTRLVASLLICLALYALLLFPLAGLLTRILYLIPLAAVGCGFAISRSVRQTSLL